VLINSYIVPSHLSCMCNMHPLQEQGDYKAIGSRATASFLAALPVPTSDVPTAPGVPTSHRVDSVDGAVYEPGPAYQPVPTLCTFHRKLVPADLDDLE